MKPTVRSLAYFVIASPHLDEWAEFAKNVVGAEVSRTPNGGVRARFDARSWRWAIEPGPDDRLTALGWELATVDELDRLATIIGAERASDEFAVERAATALASVADTAGTVHELVAGSVLDPRPVPAPYGARFVADELGLGHSVVVSPDFAASLSFATEQLGLRVTDTITRPKGVVAFLHCNPRHHSLALVQGPADAPPSLNHVMAQVDSVDAVGAVLERAEESNTLSRTLGRHTNDRMLSFYCWTPSGFELEFGTGARIIDPSNWVVSDYAATSTWGHRKLDKEDAR
ncbi:VOC family protein [Nocardia sp. CA-120079]|uniref:VOC family protein n=1 Tax=Nocardia sp. CA-120079 TaxID=3239974 RepID=UPI003D9830F3